MCVKNAVKAIACSCCLDKYIRLSGQFFMIACLSLSLMACMPLKDENVNTELFKDKYEMKARAGELKRGMSKARTFETLDVPLERFAAMNTEQVQKAVYGNSLVQGSPSELESFRKRLMNYEGFSLPYRQVASTGSLGFAKMKVDKTGHDLQLVLIFENGKLMKSNVVGEEDLKESQDQYLWSAMLKSGVGAVF